MSSWIMLVVHYALRLKCIDWADAFIQGVLQMRNAYTSGTVSSSAAVQGFNARKVQNLQRDIFVTEQQ